MSERIQICCRHCQKILAVPASAEGKQAKCPNCSSLNLVVRPAAARPEPTAAPRKARPVEPGRSSTNEATASPRQAASSSSAPQASRPRRASQSEEAKPARPAKRRARREEAFEESRWEDAYDLAPTDDGVPRGLPARHVTVQKSDKEDYRATSRAAAAGVPAHVIREIEAGGRVLQFHYAYSLIYITVWGYSKPHYLAPGQGSFLRSLPYTLMTLCIGWWGIPWGPIYTLKTLFVNMSGGLDITDEVLHDIAYQSSRGRE